MGATHRVFSTGMAAALVLAFFMTANSVVGAYNVSCQNNSQGLQVVMSSMKAGQTWMISSPFGSCLST